MKTICAWRMAVLLAALPVAAGAAENDPIDLALRAKLQALQTSFDRAVQVEKADAIRKYEAKRVEAERAKQTEVVNEINAKIAALKNEPPPKPVAPPPPSATELRVVGKWMLENDKGTSLGEMMMEKAGADLYKLTRLGGGALAVNGTYKLEGDKLVKVKAAGDPYSDSEWRISGTRLKMVEGNYKGWELKRTK